MAEDYEATLTELGKLEQGWDSYGASPIGAGAIEAVRRFLDGAAVVPCVDGGIRVEWSGRGFELEVSFAPTGEIACFWLTHNGHSLDTEEAPSGDL